MTVMILLLLQVHAELIWDALVSCHTAKSLWCQLAECWRLHDTGVYCNNNERTSAQQST